MGFTPGDALRGAFHGALGLRNYAAAVDYGSRIPEGERRGSDWLNLGVALHDLGRHADAATAARRVRELGEGWLTPHALNNAVCFGLALDPSAPPSQLTAWIADLERARGLLGETAPCDTGLLASCFGTQASVEVALGQPELALVSLEQADKLAPGSPERLVIRAKALLALGRREQAHAELRAALASAHPESSASRTARALHDEMLAAAADD